MWEIVSSVMEIGVGVFGTAWVVVMIIEGQTEWWEAPTTFLCSVFLISRGIARFQRIGKDAH